MKNIKLIFSLLIILFFVFSCNKDEAEDLTGSDITGNITFNNKYISEFDVNKDLSFNLLSLDGVTFNEVKVFEASTEIANTTIDNNAKTATFNSSVLGNFLFSGNEDEDNDDKTGKYSINTISKLSNGKEFLNDFSVYIKKELTMNNKVESVIDKDTLKTTISFKTITSLNDLDFVKVFWKKNYNGTYVEDTDFTFDDDNKEIVFEDVIDIETKYSLVVNDTLYLKFTTQKGSLTDEVMTKTAVISQDLSNEVSTLINNTSDNVYNFGGDNSITYNSPFGFNVVASSTMKFVEITTATPSDYFDETDIFNAKIAFDTGTQVTNLSNLSQGKVFIYKLDKEVEEDDINVSKTFYGIGIVESTQLINGIDEEISFKHKDGFIIGQ